MFPRSTVILVLALSSAALHAQDCPDHNAGLKLPAGFCANIFADGIGHARHLAVSKDGTVYVNTWSGRYYANDKPHDGGFLVALKDTKGSGKADKIERFGESVASGGAGGSGVALYKNWLFAENNDKILRYTLSPGSLVPTGAAEVVVSDLPLTGDHPMHPFVIDDAGNLLVDVATATNACQKDNRQAKSPGLDPCDELKTRGGIWKYDANKTGQKFSPAERYATGIRNGEGFAMDRTGHRIFVTQHGRDQLHANWPDVIKDADKEAVLPSEELVLLKQGGDYGWPACYFDPFKKKLVQAPEYGGDGEKVGTCATKIEPAAAFPAHWGPNDAIFNDATQFPEVYQKGVFIAFHGSWDRAPYRQGGYNVVFQNLAGDKAGNTCQIFADGFAGADKSPSGAVHRPSGLAWSPDGALYVTDDVKGRIYRITYKEGTNPTGHTRPCPSNTSSAGSVQASNSKPPEGTNPDAGRQVLPPGVTAETVTQGQQVFRTQTCTACHGGNGEGSPLGPKLSSGKYLWSDGSVAGLAATITKGVSQPKQFRAPMPAMGGAQLTSEQVNAVAAYVWTLSHKAPAKGAATKTSGG